MKHSIAAPKDPTRLGLLLLWYRANGFLSHWFSPNVIVRRSNFTSLNSAQTSEVATLTSELEITLVKSTREVLRECCEPAMAKVSNLRCMGILLPAFGPSFDGDQTISPKENLSLFRIK